MYLFVKICNIMIKSYSKKRFYFLMKNGRKIMTKANFTNKNFTKKLITILTSVVCAIVLSFTCFSGKTFAENELPVDFIIGTTNLRQANSFNNDNVTEIFTPSADGKYILWQVDDKFYNIEESFPNTVTAPYPLINSVTYNGVTVNKDKIATLNDYYSYDNTNGTFSLNATDPTKYYRYSDPACQDLDPMGNYLYNGTTKIQLDNSSTTVDVPNNYNIRIANFKTTNGSKNIYMSYELAKDTYVYDNENKIVYTDASKTVEVSDNVTFSRSYNYGFKYNNFSKGFVQVSNIEKEIQGITIGDNGEIQTPFDTKSINQNILVPSLTDGDIIYTGDTWKQIEYCNADGTISNPQPETKYAIIKKNDNGTVQSWAELNTNNYYYLENNKVVAYTSPDNQNSLPTLYGYKLSSGVYYKDNEDYIALKDVSIILDTNSNVICRSTGMEDKPLNVTVDNLGTVLYTSTYYYNIYKAIYHNDTIIGYDLYNQEIKVQSNYRESGYEAFLNTYYSDDNLEVLYYYNPDSKNADKFDNLFDTILVNNTSDGSVNSTSKQVILNNYTNQKDLYKNTDEQISKHINNLYVSFGDTYNEKFNNQNVILSSLSVEIKLYNSYYNGIKINANSVVDQENSTFEGGDQVSNKFWFQYMDLSNLTYSDENKIVEFSAGRYVFNFLYTTYNIAEKKFSSQQNYSYTIDIDEVSNKTIYPVIYTDDSVVVKEASNPNYYYNFQTTNYPVLIYDASEFNVAYTYKYNQYTLDYSNAIRTYSRSINNANTTDFYYNNIRSNYTQKVKTVNEYSLLNTTRAGYINNEYSSIIAKQTRISAKATIVNELSDKVKIAFNNGEYSKIAVIEYLYESKTTNIYNDTWNNNGANFEKKIVVVIGYDETAKQYHLYPYITDDKTASDEAWITYTCDEGQTEYVINVVAPNNFQSYSYLARYYCNDNINFDNALTPNLNFANNKYIAFDNDFSAIKFDNLFTQELVDFDYLVINNFEDLGKYTFKINYVTAIRKELSNNTATGISTSNNQKIDHNIISFNRVNIENIVLDRLLDAKAGGVTYIRDAYDLDLFGFKSYFNRYNIANGEAVKSELKEVDSNIYSDITPYLYSNDNIKNILNDLKNRTPQKLTSDLRGSTLAYIDNKYQSIIKVPNTNQVPIYFDYLSEFLYSDKRISESLVYRYPNFTYTDEKYCIVKNYTNYQINYFDKNSRPEDDGYYEVIIRYKYNDTNHTQVFAFVIDNSSPEVTFETLKETIESKTSKYSSWKKMINNNYTNSPVRSTWRTATYFQYEITPTLTKSNYTGITSAFGSSEGSINYALTNGTESVYNIVLNCSGKSIGVKLSGNQLYGLSTAGDLITAKLNNKEPVDYPITTYNANLKKVPLFKIAIYDYNSTNNNFTFSNTYLANSQDVVNLLPSDMYDQNLINKISTTMTGGKYIVFELLGYQWEFITYPTSTYLNETGTGSFVTGTLWGSGDYYLKLTYGSSASSNLVSKFVIDTISISSITSKRVNIGSDYNKISTEFSSLSNNIINEPFTLTYSKKFSGAQITTYYYAIPLSAMADPTSFAINLAENNKLGVTTDTWLTTKTGDEILRKRYVYDYSYKELGDVVPSSNVLQTSGSALYVFELEDSAGNKSNYYVIYDTTTPKYSLDLSEEDRNSTQYELYKIITETTTVSWGNYKAIEVFDNRDNIYDSLDISYILNDNASYVNYQPTPVESALRYLYGNSDKFKKSLFRTFWMIKDKDANDDGYQWTEIDLNGLSEQAKIEELMQQNKVVKYNNSGQIAKKYYILIPLSNTTFDYYSTSGNDNSNKSYSYDMSNPLSKNSTIVSPSAKDLSTATGYSIETIRSAVMGTYGFYGQNKYFYYVYDILGNFSGGTFWMNNDLTQAFAFILNTNSNETLSATSSVNVKDATPYSVYAASQLYFSYRDSTESNSIPSADFAYKYYPFELGSSNFYKDYSITSIAPQTVGSVKKYIVTFSKINNPSEQFTYEINATDTNNYNQDGDRVDEKLSSYPFSLRYESGNTSDNGWVSLTGENTYVNAVEKDRKYTGLINLATDTSTEYKPDCTYTAPGLYVFRRVYTDFVDKDVYNSSKIALVDRNAFSNAQNGDTKLGNDQVIQYYVYYIDRYSIIDVTSYIGTDISLAYGEYINTATQSVDADNNISVVYNDKYATIKDYSEIKFDSNEKQSNSNNYASRHIVANNITNYKPYTQFNIPIDKYNQMSVALAQLGKYNKAIDFSDAYKTYNNISDVSGITEAQYNEFYNEFVAKYLFDDYAGLFKNGTYYNSKFMLDVQLTNGSDTVLRNNNIATGKNGLLNIYNRTTNSESITDASSKTSRLNLINYKRNDITSIILNNTNMQSYVLDIQDRSQTNKLISDSNTSQSFDGNELNFNLTLNTDNPTGSLLTKNSVTSTNNYNTNNMEDYKLALFGKNGDLSTGDINKLDKLSSSLDPNDPNVSIMKYYDSNKEVLLFLIDNSTVVGTKASTNPYQINIVKDAETVGQQSTTIFSTQLTFSFDNNGNKIANYQYLTCANSVDQMKTAFIENSYYDEAGNYVAPTMWAIVVFDNDAKNESYHNLLSNAKDNATYSVNISHYGTGKDYTGSATSTLKNNQRFNTRLQITQDHEKPLYNIINLMERDTFVKKGNRVPTYNNIAYTNIETYYKQLLTYRTTGQLTDLQIQKCLKDVYNYYITFYRNINYLGQEDSYLQQVEDQFGETEYFWNNYYFIIDDQFTFAKCLSDESGIGLDTAQNIFVRKIPDITSYYYSLTVDDFTNSTGMNNHNIFQDSNALTYPTSSNVFEADTYYKKETNDDKTITVNQLYFETNNYYEIIERDSAGNYRVYLVKYIDNGNKYNIKYTDPSDNKHEVSLDERNPVFTTDSNNYNPIIGKTINFTTTTTRFSEQDIVKIELTYAFKTANNNNSYTSYTNTGKPIIISSTFMDRKVHVYYDTTVSNPITFADSTIISDTTQAIDKDQILNTALNKLNTIISTISEMYKDTALDFAFNIAIYNRCSSIGQYKVDYLTQGQELQLEVRTTSDGVYITIPNDEVTRCTKIFSLEAYQYTATGISTTPMDRDSNGNSMPNSNNKTSLGGKTYFFRYYKIGTNDGAYKIVTKDNFGRTSIHYYSRPDSVKYNIEVKNSQTYLGETYTASDINIQYNSQLYNVFIYEEASTSDENKTYNIVTKFDENKHYPIAQDNNNPIRYNNNVWTRYSIANTSQVLYTVTRTISGPTIRLTIHQNIDIETKFIILVVERPNEYNDSTKDIYDNGLYKGYYQFINNYANKDSSNCLYDDNSKITMYTKIPAIQLLNLSGKTITDSKRQTTGLVFIENLRYTKTTEDVKFPTKLSILRNNINYSTDSDLLTDGKYIITLQNDLNYSQRIEFEINTNNSTSDYSLYTKKGINDSDPNNLVRSDYVTKIYYKSNNNVDDSSDVRFAEDKTNNYTKSARLYHYYTTNNYFAGYKQDINGNIITDTSKNHIYIVVNSNNLLECKIINYTANDQDNGTYSLYIVQDSKGNVIEYFIIHFITENTSIEFSGMTIATSKTYTAPNITSSTISRDDSKLYLVMKNISNMNSGNGNTTNEYMRGNTLTITYHYNNNKIESRRVDKLATFKQGGEVFYYYEISETGVHRIEITDLAGNKSVFNGQKYLNIYLVNSILYSINNNYSIPNYITNDAVTLRLIETVERVELYKINSQEINITRNGLAYSINQSSTNEYNFTEAGTYVINVSATNERNLTNPTVTHTIEFTIVNYNVAYNSYTISSAKGFTISKVTKMLENTENARRNELPELANKNSLLISCDTTGSGYYEITLSKYLESKKSNVEYSFRVWLNDRTDSTIIIPSIPFGTETTDTITIRYNPANIFNNVGDSYITINDTIIETINGDSVSETKSYDITNKGVYWIKIVSANGQILASYKLTKNDPLNTTAKIIIIVAVAFTVTLVVIFIILRRKTKFR